MMRMMWCGVAAAMMSLALPTVAPAKELVLNGGFETATNGPGQLGYNTNATGWTTTGYNFLFAAGTADKNHPYTNLADETPSGVYGHLPLWGPANGSANGMTASSPSGGNFVGADGAFGLGAISQTITGLVAGANYTVTFEWAAAQQYNYTGDTTERWLVSLDNQALPNGVDNLYNPTMNAQTQSTAVLSNPSHDFQAWRTASMTFTAKGATQVLSFLAVGTPEGKPPFSLLDNVSMKAAVPESGTWAMMIVGFGSVGGTMRRRRAIVARAAA